MSARQLGLYLAFGLLAYLVAVVVLAPAAWLSQSIERASQQRLELRDPAGSAWSGSGRLYARTRAGDFLGAVPENVQEVLVGLQDVALRIEFDDGHRAVDGIQVALVLPQDGPLVRDVLQQQQGLPHRAVLAAQHEGLGAGRAVALPAAEVAADGGLHRVRRLRGQAGIQPFGRARKAAAVMVAQHVLLGMLAHLQEGRVHRRHMAPGVQFDERVRRPDGLGEGDEQVAGSRSRSRLPISWPIQNGELVLSR